MKFANATNLHRKSGGAQWRDLLFLFQFSRKLFSPIDRSATLSATLKPGPPTGSNQPVLFARVPFNASRRTLVR
jgi:hypothetical protein